jgi:hypothetical protein
VKTPLLLSVLLLTMGAGTAALFLPPAAACIDCYCGLTVDGICVPVCIGIHQVCPDAGTCSPVTIGVPQATFFSGYAGTGCGVGGTAYECTYSTVHNEPAWSCQPVATLP